MKTKGLLLFGIALFSFAVVSAQPRHKGHHGKMHKMAKKAYEKQAKRDRKAYKHYLKQEEKRHKQYVKHMEKRGDYPVYYEQRYYNDRYYNDAPYYNDGYYRRGTGVAIDGEVFFRNGSIRLGYYD